MAGNIQGRLDGDLGDLGQASLSERLVTDLLDLVVQKTEKIVHGEANGTATDSRPRRYKAAASGAFWRPLDLRQQLLLELAARLLACGQRLYLARVGWDAIENPEEYLGSFLKIPGPDGDDEWLDQERPAEPTLAPETLARSPYMSLILRGLTTENHSVFATQIEDIIIGGKDSSDHERESSLLSVLHILGGEGNRSAQDSPLPSLAIIGACAECFPAGLCWTSNAAENWSRLLPDDKSNDEVVHCHRSSQCDLAVLLLLLCNLLEVHGKPEGDPLAQYWILLTLTKLTDATAILFLDMEIESSHVLTTVWRRIWSTLLRIDLRYVGYSKGSIQENSMGEIVLVLLTEIVRLSCTETPRLNTHSLGTKEYSFVLENQLEIWNLELFKPSVNGSILSKAPFELLSALLRYAGLFNSRGHDLVCDEETLPGRVGGLFSGGSLRHRLVRFVVNQLEGAIQRRTESAKVRLFEDSYVGQMGRCLAGLFNGYFPSTESSSSSKDPRFFLSTFDLSPSGVHGCLVEDIKIGEPLSEAGLFLSLLWPPKQMGTNEFKSELVNSYEHRFDFPRLVAWRLRSQLNKEQERKRHQVTYYVPDSVSDPLRKDFILFVKNTMSSFKKDTRTDCDRSQIRDKEKSVTDAAEPQSQLISLSLHTGLVKLMLSAFAISTKQSSATSGVLEILHDVATNFGNLLSQLARVRYDRDDYFLVARDLKQIAQALVEVHIRQPSIVISEVASESIDSCQALLKLYGGRGIIADPTSSFVSSNRTGPGSTQQNWSDDEGSNAIESPTQRIASDDSEGDDSARGKKRTLSGRSGRGRKRRRNSPTFFSPPNLPCAREIGSLLIALDPSASNCSLVCESLLGTELNLEPDSIHGDMDLRSATTCLQILSLETVLLNRMAKHKLLNESETNEGSAVVLFCRAIDLIRACANSSSTLYMYGNKECCEVAGSVFQSGLKLPEDEAKMLVEILSDFNGMQNRHRLKGERLRAATKTFEKASQSFHQLFDKQFIKSFVKLGFDDPSFLVRRLASVAAGAASRFLDEDKVLRGVKSQIAPASKTIDGFLDWYSTRTFTEDRNGISEMSAQDAMEVMESDSIFAQSHLGGSIQQTATLHNIILDILEVGCSRIGMEFVCYRALDKIAHMREYSDVQEMIDLESESLLVIWLERRTTGKFHDNTTIFLPTLTGPASLYRLMIYGQYNFFCHDHLSAKTSDDVKPFFSGNSMINYVARYRRLLVSVLFLNVHSSISEIESPSVMAANLANEPTFKIILTILEQGDSKFDSLIIKLLKKYAVEIQSICTLLQHSEDNKAQIVARIVQRNLSVAVSPEFVGTHTKKYLDIMVVRILDFAGKCEGLGMVAPNSELAFRNAMSSLMDLPDESMKSYGDDFLKLGSSLTELSIFASNELARSRMRNQLNCWSRFKLLSYFLVGQIQQGGGEQIQLGFFLHILTDILLKKSLVSIQPQVLLMMKAILTECRQLNKEVLRVEVAPCVKRLLGVSFYIHESYQCILLQRSRLEQLQSETLLRRSCGLNLRTDGGTWGWDLPANAPISEGCSSRSFSLSNAERDCLTGTFDIILLIFETRGLFTMDSLPTLFEFSNEDIDTLAEVDKRFAAQRLTHGFVDDVDSIDGALARCASMIRNYVLKSHFWTTQDELFEDEQEFGFGNRFETTLTIDQRLLYSELKQLQNLIRAIESRESEKRLSNGDLKMLSDDLCSICSSGCPKLLRFAASQCMAVLWPNRIVDISNLPRSQNLSDCFDKHSHTMMKVSCVESLADCLKSPNAEVAKAAVRTLDALFSTKDGAKAFSMVDDLAKPLISPFMTKDSHRRNLSGALSRNEVKSLRKAVGHQAQGLDDSKNWCWDKQLWTLRDGRQFEDWICHVTPSLIICCFEISSDANGGREHESQTAHFFWECQRVARLDHRFASAVFPVLVLELLNLSERCGSKEVERSDGLNVKLTVAFESLLHSCIRPEKSNRSNARKEAISLIVDTLDAIRIVSQKNFLSSKHPRNVLRSSKEKVKAKNSDKHEKTGYNDGLPTPPPWNGLPFGVVLRLDGLLVADACMTVQKFASALFFIDLYLNARYGMAGGLYEEISSTMSCQKVVRNFKSRTEISGLPFVSRSFDTSEHSLKISARKAMSMATKCYDELHEVDSMFATRMQLSSLNFMDGTIKGSGSNILDDIACSASQEDLLTSSGESLSPCASNRLPLLVADTMEELGLHELVPGYINGVLGDNDVLREQIDGGELREKWFETNLDVQNWNKLLTITKQRGAQETEHSRPVDTQPPLSARIRRSRSNATRGFFESIYEALDSFSQNDTTEAVALLEEARLSALDSMSNFGGEKPSAEGVAAIFDKLRALKDVDDLVADAFNPAASFDFKEEDSWEITQGMRQTVLVASATKKPHITYVFDVLKDHLWKTCANALDRGLPHAAELSLTRLRSLWTVEVVDTSVSLSLSDDVMRMRFEEARILECRGDFNGAIHRMKQLIGFFLRNNASDGLGHHLLTDAQLLCGFWMTKYKTQQARVILESFMKPGVSRATHIFESDQSARNAERATHGSMKLGHLVATLYDDLSTRVFSNEWKQTGARIGKQEDQLQDSVKLLKTLKSTLGKGSKKEREETQRQVDELTVFCIRTEKETSEIRNERSNLEKLIGVYLKLGLKAFMSALKIAGTGGSGDLSNHVFRMVSLWFSSQENPLTERNEVNELIFEQVAHVPSFRFVPLTNQLFARIENHEKKDDRQFQHALQTLMFRMCNDHPYHCLVPVIALANGKSVGAGLGKGETSTFLENIGNSKVAAASKIIDRLRTEGLSYIQDLVESYLDLCSAYIDLADVPTKHLSSAKNTKDIPFSQAVNRSKKPLDRCLHGRTLVPCVLTSPPLLRPGKDYGDGVVDPIGGERIAGFEPFFNITDSGKLIQKLYYALFQFHSHSTDGSIGIHRPKIVVCVGSQGGRFRQIVKGEDDIRQDAIMSQVFSYVNKLMDRNDDTKSTGPIRFGMGQRRARRKLKMVTYNILPLNPTSGVSFREKLNCCCQEAVVSLLLS